MSGKIQLRLAVLTVLIALVAMLVPGGPATGTHDAGSDGDFLDGSAGVLRLHLGDDGDYFGWTDTAAVAHLQNYSITRCEVTLGLPGDADLVTFDAPGSGTTDRGPGFKDHGTGVKSGGSQGVRCARVSGPEVLHLAMTETGLLSDFEIVEAHLDIEVKQGAEVEVTTYFGEAAVESFYLRSGSAIVPGQGTDPPAGKDYLATSTASAPIANCANRSDSGPDAGAKDNCRWVIKDLTPFTGMTMKALSGEFTLEGGNDGTPAVDPGEPFGLDTLLFLTDIDGVLDCGDTVTVGDAINSPEGVFTRLDFFTTPTCELKPYKIGSEFGQGSNSIDFLPEGAVEARYSARLTSIPYSSLGENPVSQQLRYDRDGIDTVGNDGVLEFETMAWCLTADIVYEADMSGGLVVDPETGLVERIIQPATDSSSNELPILPPDGAGGTHTWCIADMETRVSDGSMAGFGSGQIQTTWWVYGEDDPNFDFS